MRIFTLVAVLFLSLSVSATTVTGEKAMGLIDAFRLLGVVSDATTVPGQLIYQHDIYCTRGPNTKVDNTSVHYGFPLYLCDIGSGKAVGLRAKLLFDGGALTFGTATSDLLTVTSGVNVDCRIVLVESDAIKRFTCSFQ